MKKRLFIFGIIASLAAFVSIKAANTEVAPEALAAEMAEAKTVDPKEIPKISKAFGHIIGQNLESLGLDFDMAAVIHGIQDSLNGIESPMSESECFQAISVIQENAFKKQSEDNLKKAEDFLTTNKAKQGVVELEAGKLQYLQMHEGSGELVKESDSPLIRYKGKFLNGKVFGESQENESISLNETIAGFKKAIVGMKEGEKREVYIHPELGYGTQGYFPPNELLTFEIEVVKANAPKAPEPALTQGMDAAQHLEEIATMDTEAATAVK